MQKAAGRRFIYDNFEQDDRLAIVLIDRKSGAVTQRVATARHITSPEFQAWLSDRNRMGADVFVSMNALAEDARGRTRGEVSIVRHLYLDFDENGTKAMEHLQSRADIPKPNWVVNTSPDHWQVSWRVQGFGKEQAEETMRDLVREFGADPAATDCARVMRIPGFVNHKRNPGHFVRADQLSNALYSPDHFPRLTHEDRLTPSVEVKAPTRKRGPQNRLSQSELDWAYAKRALARGETPDSVIAAIAAFRRGDKADPEYYARLTVSKAVATLEDATHVRAVSEPER